MQQGRLKSRGTFFMKAELLVCFTEDVNIIGGLDMNNSIIGL